MDNYVGNDNYGRPKQEFIDKISLMTDKELESETSSNIYMSAFCANNPRADWHWMVDACYDECEKREDKNIYRRAYKSVAP